MLDLITRQKGLNNIPGEEWIYSNTNYFLLAEVVKRATRKSLAEFAAENIFQPLGMVHTRYYDDHTLVSAGPGCRLRSRKRWPISGGLVSPVSTPLVRVG